MKRNAFFSFIALFSAICGCGQTHEVKANDIHNIRNAASEVEITGFRDYEWQTPLSKIEEDLTANGISYSVHESSTFGKGMELAKEIFIMTSDTGIINAATTYIFWEDGLVGGMYRAGGANEGIDMDAYYEKFGEPTETFTESVLNVREDCDVWVDADQDFVMA